MSRKYKFRDQEKLYFVTATTVNWVDLFIRNEYRDLLLESLRYCQHEKGLEIYAWCLMTSHLHLIIGTHDKPMEGIMRDMKRHTSKYLKKAIEDHPQESRKEWLLRMMTWAGTHNRNNHNWQLWQQDNHPQELFYAEMLGQKLDYIHMNPVVAGFVSEPQHYLYSSAVDYAGGKGLLDIEVLSLVGL